MRRQRLRTTTGCLRCRRRKKKCDELRPTCSYCKRWNLGCVWPEARSPRTESESSHSVGSSIRDERQLTRASIPRSTGGQCSMGTFHKLPIIDAPGCSSPARLLKEFFASVTDNNITFDIPDKRSEVVSVLADSVLSDDAVCYAFLSYWAKCLRKRTGSRENDAIGFDYERRTVALLRHRIESGRPISEGTLHAAAVHCATLAFDVSDRREVRKILLGVKALVDSLGGVDWVKQNMNFGTVLSLMITDILNSLLNEDAPYFLNLAEPIRPESFRSLYIASFDETKFLNDFDAETLYILEKVAFLLFFRQPSAQIRPFLLDEGEYINGLVPWVDYTLGIMQSRRVNDHSLSKIMVVAMIIVKQEVVANGPEHTVLISALLQRLRDAIEQCAFQTATVYPALSMWASLVATVGDYWVPQRDWFYSFMKSFLFDRFGTLAWPPSWMEQIRRELQQFPWHQRINLQYGTVCRMILSAND